MAKSWTISEVAEFTGLSTSVLRIWEARYGWPKPTYLDNGYRSYSRSTIDDLKRISDLLQHGAKIGEIIMDGKPHWPNRLMPKPTRPAFDFSVIPLPQTQDAQEVRRKLEQALLANDPAMIEWAIAQALLLHPRERDSAVHALLRLADR